MQSDWLTVSLYYALINRARGPYEEIFVLTFKAYGPNAVSDFLFLIT